jgi:hypothetical protein
MRALRRPGLAIEEPFFRGRIGGSAQERRDQQVMTRLGGRQIHADPDSVARREIRHLGGGRVVPARVTVASSVGPARSNGADPAWAAAARAVAKTKSRNGDFIKIL